MSKSKRQYQPRQPVYGAQHGIVCANIAYEFRKYLAQAPIAVCFGAGTGFRVSDKSRVIVVDAAIVRNERISEGLIDGDVFRGAPDVAVIVVSPQDRFDEVERDVQAMLQHGTRNVWIVRPRVRMVTVHGGGHDVSIVGETENLTADVLPAFSVPVQALFEST